MALIEISGIWKNKSKEGEIYLTGYMGKARIVIFKNKYKKEEKHPDFVLYVSEPLDKKKAEDDDLFGEGKGEDIAF